jgi:hypothetical protein
MGNVVYQNTKNGSFVEAQMSDKEAVDVLKEKKQDNNFCMSLVKQSEQFRGLSENQWFWVHKIANETVDRIENPRKPAAHLPNFKPVLDRGYGAIKYPKLTIYCGDFHLRFQLCGPASKTPGFVTVLRFFGKNVSEKEYLGKINLEGDFWPAANLEDKIIRALEILNQDPESAAIQSGKISGNCAYCFKALTDERSLEVGYGPICAKTFRLPWGN